MEEKYTQEDEIDLKELLKVIWKNKVFIIIFTLVLTLLGVGYAISRPTPPFAADYEGNLAIAIGEFQESDKLNSRSIENSKMLVQVVNEKFLLPEEKALSYGNRQGLFDPKSKSYKVRLQYDGHLEAFNRGEQLMLLIVTGKTKEKVTSRLNDAYQFIIDRHKQRIKGFANYRMTEKVGEIVIVNKTQSVEGKAKLVAVAFVIGLFLSIFLVFFWRFVRDFKEELAAEKNEGR